MPFELEEVLTIDLRMRHESLRLVCVSNASFSDET